MVPSVRALETLHNALTLSDVNSFLQKAMSIGFNTPASSPPNEASLSSSQRPSIVPLGVLHKAQSLSSSTNSSAGPSSPTSCSTPVDLWQRLTMFISDNQNLNIPATTDAVSLSGSGDPSEFSKDPS
ncbi:inositol hexakisphosphate and diphosphoinositol-pentakisphosphate kinase 1 [Octopus sinensis]|nr:inositol hexakisphosphate and diphosphoinositol-pentakisphosphate kinase 1 [Octopus sinensis]